MTAVTTNPQSELDAIRTVCERVLRTNPDDSTLDLVSRMAYLAWPETASRRWFERWQRAHRMNERLVEALRSLLELNAMGDAAATEMLPAMELLLSEAKAPVFAEDDDA